MLDGNFSHLSFDTDIAPLPSSSLASALAGLPGLVLQEGFGGFDPPRITSRGSGLQSAPVSRGLVLELDGLPLNAADGSFNTALLEPALFGQVRLAHGASDPAAAALALGGSLDFSSADTSRAAVTAGSDGLWRGVLQGRLVAAAAPGKLEPAAVSAGLACTHSDGWRDWSAQDRTVAAVNATFRLSEDLDLRAGFFGANPRFDVPGPLTRAAAESAPSTIAATTVADRPRRATEFARAALTATWHPGETLLRASVAGQHNTDYFRQLRANGLSDTRGNDVLGRLEFGQTLGPVALSAGALAESGRRSQERWTNVTGAAGRKFADLLLRAETGTAWCDAAWHPLPSLTLEAGVSALAASRETSGTIAARTSFAAAAPRVGVSWAVVPVAVLFAGASRGTEAPTFDDLLAAGGTAPNLQLAWTPLRIQRADTVETGLRGTRAQGRFGYGITAYAARWHDELLRLADASGAARGTVNAGPTCHRGVETAVCWRLLDGPQTLDLSATHTWSDARFDHDPVQARNRLAGLPPHAGAAELAWADQRGPFAAVGADWIAGHTWADHGNRLGYGGHVLWNARTGWRARRWTFAFAVTNLFDRRYIASTSGVIDVARTPAGTALFLPGSPRAITGSLERRW